MLGNVEIKSSCKSRCGMSLSIRTCLLDWNINSNSNSYTDKSIVIRDAGSVRDVDK